MNVAKKRIAISKLTLLKSATAIIALLAVGLTIRIMGVAGKANAFGAYVCASGFNRVGGVHWDNGAYSHDLWAFTLSATPADANGNPDSNLWNGPNNWDGLETTSQGCNDDGSGRSGPHGWNPNGDNVIVTSGALAAPDGRMPTGMELGLQRNDAVNQGAGGQINNGLWQAPNASGAVPVDRPPVFEYNWESPSALADDSGAFIIGGGGAFAGNHLIWCQAFVDTNWDASTAGCGPDITSGGSPNGAGSLMNFSDCNLSNGAAVDPAYPIDPGNVAQCSDPNVFSWIKTPGQTEDIAGTAIGRSPTGQLNNFTAHTASRNTVNGGAGATTWVQVDYPDVNFQFTATCSGINYQVTDPLPETPPTSFSINGGPPIPAFGSSGTIPLPPNSYGNIQVFGSTSLDGEPFSNTQTINCLPPPQCGSFQFLPAIAQPNQNIEVDFTIIYPQAGWSVTLSVPGTTSTTTIPIDPTTGLASWKYLTIPNPGYYQVLATFNNNYYGQQKVLNCGTESVTPPSGCTSAGCFQPNSCPPDQTSCQPGAIVSLEPYAKFYGGDALAGSGFTNPNTSNCSSNASAGIYGWSNSDFSGAGTQLAATALGTISGFTSSQGSTVANALSFANTGGSPGGFGGVPCTPDYYDQNGDPSGDTGFNSGSFAASTLPPDSYYASGPAATTLGSLGIPTVNIGGGTTIIYVSGDVHIDSNIVFSGPIDPSNPPYFEVVAKGNIYIDKGVSQLDGVYVAEGDGTNTGIIDDCYDESLGSLPTKPNFNSDCSQQKLIVNGSLIAGRLNLMRTGGQSVDGADHNYNAGGCVTLAGCTSNAAEVLNYSPLAWLGSPNTGIASASYSSIIGLPPIL